MYLIAYSERTAGRLSDQNKSFKTLITNTVIFAIGSFSSKLLVLILVPLYTACLSPAEYGTTDLIAQTANILIPIFTLSVAEAALRFGLDSVEELDKKKVYTVCMSVFILGMAVMSLIFPILSMLDYIDGYALILFIYVCTSSLRQIHMFFTRGLRRVKIFAIDGVICTLVMLLLNILFLLKLNMGITGYLLAIILSDLVSSIFLFVSGRLWRYISPKSFDKDLAVSMVKYSAPLMSANLLWLVTSISDRFIVNIFHGEAVTGINSIAYKIPTVLTTVFTMFSQAWNMSAISENSSKDREKFYTDVFRYSQSFMYILTAGILLLIKPVTKVWINAQYFESYLYSPILTVATVFTCFNTFLGSVYIAEKKTKHSFYTSLSAGIINLVLNFALIPKFGIYGAAAATFAAYFLVFFYRLFDTRKLIHYEFSMPKILINTAVMAAMVIINQLSFSSDWTLYALLGLMFLISVALNIRDLWDALVLLMPKKLTARLPKCLRNKE